jgi:hypothetical protein
LPDRLGATHAHITEHFRFEEEAGYMADRADAKNHFRRGEAD